MIFSFIVIILRFLNKTVSVQISKNDPHLKTALSKLKLAFDKVSGSRPENFLIFAVHFNLTSPWSISDLIKVWH